MENWIQEIPNISRGGDARNTTHTRTHMGTNRHTDETNNRQPDRNGKNGKRNNTYTNRPTANQNAIKTTQEKRTTSPNTPNSHRTIYTPRNKKPH